MKASSLRLASIGILILTLVGSPTPAQAGRKPNLKVVSLSEPPVAMRSHLDASDKTKNSGRGTAQPSSTGFFLSSDQVFDAGDDTELSDLADNPPTTGRPVPRLRPRRASSADTSLFLYIEPVASGLYYLVACADRDAVIAETNEADNCRFSTTQVDVDNALRLTSAEASTGHVLLMLDHAVDPTTLQSDGSQFAIPGLSVISAEFGSIGEFMYANLIDLTTTAQNVAPYTVTVDGTLEDTAGNAVDPDYDTLGFTGAS